MQCISDGGLHLRTILDLPPADMRAAFFLEVLEAAAREEAGARDLFSAFITAVDSDATQKAVRAIRSNARGAGSRRARERPMWLLMRTSAARAASCSRGGALRFRSPNFTRSPICELALPPTLAPAHAVLLCAAV